MTVIFSTVFKEETDRIYGKVFLQEFVDARRRPSCQTAPQVLYSNREPPLEIRHLPALADGENVGYVTFGERHGARDGWDNGAQIRDSTDTRSAAATTVFIQSCFRDTLPMPMWQRRPLPKFRCSAITCTTTSSVPRLTSTRGCATA